MAKMKEDSFLDMGVDSGEDDAGTPWSTSRRGFKSNGGWLDGVDPYDTVTTGREMNSVTDSM